MNPLNYKEEFELLQLVSRLNNSIVDVIETNKEKIVQKNGKNILKELARADYAIRRAMDF